MQLISTLQFQATAGEDDSPKCYTAQPCRTWNPVPYCVAENNVGCLLCSCLSPLFSSSPQRSSSPKVLFFHSIEIVVQGHSASSLKCSKHNVYAKLMLELHRTMDVFSRLPFLNWHFKTLMKFSIVHGTAFLEVFVTGKHFIFMQPAPFIQMCFACLPLPGFEWETQALWITLSGGKGLTLLQNPIPTANWSNVMLMEHSSREFVRITLHLYSVCIQWSLSVTVLHAKSLSSLCMQFSVYMFISSAIYFDRKQSKYNLWLCLFHLYRAALLLVSLAI